MSRIQQPLGLNSAFVDRFLETEGAFAVNKFGENPASGGNTWETIWDEGGLYSFPATADITHILQAVDQETMRGQKVQVQGLNASWDLVTQEATLNGTLTTNAVQLATPLRRVFRAKVHANVVTDQDINIKNVGGGTTYATITAGNNQTLMAVYTVPRNYVAYMTNYYISHDARDAECRLMVADRKNSYEFQLKHMRFVAAEAPFFQHHFNPYFKIGEQSDIKLDLYSVATEGNSHGGFDLILVPDS